MAARSPSGFSAAGIHCGIKAPGERDLALIASDRPAAVAGVFTTSRFPGPPVTLSRARARRGRARAVVVNSGISNVAMGERGLRDAREMSLLTARALGVPVGEVLVSSTGVIGRPLPMPALRTGIPQVAGALSPSGWRRAADAIRTTDLVPKLARAGGPGFSMVGIAKGSGMIMPNMATMLAYVATDLAVEPGFLRAALSEVNADTFNCLTIDGETSTSDTVLVLANGAAGNRPIGSRSARAKGFVAALHAVCEELVEKLAADGEGVTRVAEVLVTGARTRRAADRVARSIANSMLVKTAIFGADPNWGRVVQAVGAAGVPLRPGDVSIRFAGVELMRAGQPVEGPGLLARAERGMKRKRVRIEVSIGRGPGRARLLTTDLSYEYVRINAEYTT